MTGERAALNILLRVTQEDAYLNLALKEGLKYAERKDKPRLTALVYNTVEHIGFCDYIIGHYAKGRIHSNIRGILRMAVAELVFMKTPDYAVCSKAVALTKEIGKAELKGYVNGVLRNIARDLSDDSLPKLPPDFIERMSIVSSYPVFLVKEYAAKYGEAFTEEMLTAAVKGVSVRPVPPCTPDELKKNLLSRGISFRKSDIVDGALVVDSLGGALDEDRDFLEGRFAVQSEGAMLAVKCLDPKSGMAVLDACAAPGGKTAYISELMGKSGELEAWELHPHRAALTESTLKRFGIELKCSVRDASVFDASFTERFDRVLLDVPCSGLGAGSKPDARLRRTEDDIITLATIQRKILDTCSKYLKVGGVLVYSTCTISWAENEDTIEDFIKRNGNFELVPVTGSCSDDILKRGENGMLQLFPNTDGVDGFFIAKLRRKA